MAREGRPPDPVREHPLNNAFYQWMRGELATVIRRKLAGASQETLANDKAEASRQLDMLKAQLQAL